MAIDGHDPYQNFTPEMARTVSFFIGLLIGSSGSFAQATGQVRIMSEPDLGMRYVLDNKYELNDREITLTEGDHRFIFWAPEHQMLDTSIFVMGNWTIDLKVKLRRPYEYVAYRSAVEKFERKQRLGRIIPPIVAGGIGVWAVISNINYANANSELQDLGDLYRTSSDPGEIFRLKEEQIPDAKDRFANARTQAYVSTGLFVASLGAVAYIRKKAAQAKPPVYEDQEKVKFEGLVWVPGPSGGTWATAITIPLR